MKCRYFTEIVTRALGVILYLDIVLYILAKTHGDIYRYERTKQQYIRTTAEETKITFFFQITQTFIAFRTDNL